MLMSVYVYVNMCMVEDEEDDYIEEEDKSVKKC